MFEARLHVSTPQVVGVPIHDRGTSNPSSGRQCVDLQAIHAVIYTNLTGPTR